jgi:hypothetical protein
MKKEDDELIKATEVLNATFDEAPNPPPHFEEALETLSDVSTGVDEEELRTRREAFLVRLGQGRSLGELLRRRREAMDIDIEEISRRSSWRSSRRAGWTCRRLTRSVSACCWSRWGSAGLAYSRSRCGNWHALIWRCTSLQVPSSGAPGRV